MKCLSTSSIVADNVRARSAWSRTSFADVPVLLRAYASMMSAEAKFGSRSSDCSYNVNATSHFIATDMSYAAA